MRVCLACFETRLAAVFENASELRLYKVCDDNICPVGHLPLPSKDPTDTISATLACGADLLICGAVCGRTRNTLEASGLRVIPWVGGTIEKVLEAYTTQTLDNLAMPGCRNARRQRGLCRGKGQGPFFSRLQHAKE
jgi:predicted Fe-Mo cluster-binding NifX family protein